MNRQTQSREQQRTETLTRSRANRDIPTHEDDEDNDAFYDTRPSTSARRYWTTTGEHPQHPPKLQQQVIKRPRYDVQVHQDYELGTIVPARRSRRNASQTDTQTTTHTRQATTTTEHSKPVRRHPRRMHWLVHVAIGMFAVLLLFVLGSLVLSWWHGVQDTMTYGMPRTYQCDAVVGHADSAEHPTHFLALNLHGHIEVIELPGGDATHARVYPGPVLLGSGQERTPVTLSFADVNGDGKLDMLVHIGTQTLVFLNTGSAFRPATASDHVTM